MTQAERRFDLGAAAWDGFYDGSNRDARRVKSRLDPFAPRLAYRAARRAERSPRLRRVFATQRLVVARKR